MPAAGSGPVVITVGTALGFGPVSVADTFTLLDPIDMQPSLLPSMSPSKAPSEPSDFPSKSPTPVVTRVLSVKPTSAKPISIEKPIPTLLPSSSKTTTPSGKPTFSVSPTIKPQTNSPSKYSTVKPTFTASPTAKPHSSSPTMTTTRSPSVKPTTLKPSSSPHSVAPSTYPTISPTAALPDSWKSQGGDIYNSRYLSPTNTKIRGSNLNLKGGPSNFFDVNSSVYATPAIFGDYLIFPADDGNLYAFNKTSGKLFWKNSIKKAYFKDPKLHSKITFTPNVVVSRTTPVKYRNSFLLGTIDYCSILRIDIKTGTLIGKVRLSSLRYARITMSGTVLDNNFYVGVASSEESASGNPSYPCCSFVGSFHSIDIPSMSVVWDWYTIPLNTVGPAQLSGAAIWGSSPSIDVDTGLVYFATGDNYYVPDELTSCYNITAPANWEKSCNAVLAPENWFESVIALNIFTGQKVWAKRVSSYDAWSIACVFKNNPNCPIIPGLDYDFGMAPVLSTVNNKKVLFIGQKSGIVYSFNATTGSIIWAKQTSPGSIVGGHSWGISVDDTQVYASVANYFHLPWTLKNGTTTVGGGWVALDKKSGNITWTTANPAGYDPTGIGLSKSNRRIATSWGMGPSSVVGDVVLVGSADIVGYNYGSGGYVYSLKKTDGKIISSYETKAGVYGGFSADNNCAYIGHGYPLFGLAEGSKEIQ